MVEANSFEAAQSEGAVNNGSMQQLVDAALSHAGNGTVRNGHATGHAMKANRSRRSARSSGRACIPPVSDSPPDEHTRAPELPPVEKFFNNFNLLKSARLFDPTRPTVAVLDDFQKAEFAPNGGNQPGLAHGEVSAAAADQAGFNVLRLHMFDSSSLSDALKEVATAAESGKLPLKRNDAVNVSYGVGDAVSWKDASCALKLSIRPETYARLRPEVMRRMDDIASGRRAAHPDDKEFMDGAVEIHETVAQLQAAGIDVVHASGNDGAGKFDLHFMNANIQLSASDKRGHLWPYSAGHSLTRAYPSSFELYYRPYNFLDPTPLVRQVGRYQLEDYPVYFPAEKFGGRLNHNHFAACRPDGDPETGELPKHARSSWSKDWLSPPMVEYWQNRFAPEKLSVKSYVSQLFEPLVRRWDNWFHTNEIRADKYTATFDPAAKSGNIGVVRVRPGDFYKLVKPPSDRPPVEVVNGTSFSNVTYWFDRWKQLHK